LTIREEIVAVVETFAVMAMSDEVVREPVLIAKVEKLR
jgi:hypothetical protein